MTNQEITYSKLASEDKHLLLQSISNILVETEAHDFSTAQESAWNWQYEDLPSKESQVYVAKSDGNIIAYYHIPCYEIKIDDQSYKIGHIQSVAVLKEYRGKGVFQKLATFANKDIDNHLDLIYTFPNHKSSHTFTKYNEFKLINSLPIYVLPLDIAQILSSKFKLPKLIKRVFSLFDIPFRLFSIRLNKNEKLITFNEVTPEIEALFLNFGKNNRFRLLRDKEFINWRYLNSPKGEHKLIGLVEDKELKAVAVVKKEEMFSSKGLVVMDLAYKKPRDLQKLLSNLSKAESLPGDSSSFVFISGLNKGIRSLKYCGFIPVPQRFVPRKLNLLARWTKNEMNGELINDKFWLVTIGDWDVF